MTNRNACVLISNVAETCQWNDVNLVCEKVSKANEDCPNLKYGSISLC